MLRSVLTGCSILSDALTAKLLCADHVKNIPTHSLSIFCEVNRANNCIHDS